MEFSVTLKKLKARVIFQNSSIAGLKKQVYFFYYYLFIYLFFDTMLSMTEQPLNTWMCGQNIFLTEGEKNTTQQDTCQKFNPPLSKPLRFCPNPPRPNSLAPERTTMRNRSDWGGGGGPKRFILRLSALLSVDSNVTSTPLLSFKSPISFVWDKGGL